MGKLCFYNGNVCGCLRWECKFLYRRISQQTDQLTNQAIVWPTNILTLGLMGKLCFHNCNVCECLRWKHNSCTDRSAKWLTKRPTDLLTDLHGKLHCHNCNACFQWWPLFFCLFVLSDHLCIVCSQWWPLFVCSQWWPLYCLLSVMTFVCLFSVMTL